MNGKMPYNIFVTKLTELATTLGRKNELDNALVSKYYHYLPYSAYIMDKAFERAFINCSWFPKIKDLRRYAAPYAKEEADRLQIEADEQRDIDEAAQARAERDEEWEVMGDHEKAHVLDVWESKGFPNTDEDRRRAQFVVRVRAIRDIVLNRWRARSAETDGQG